MIVTILIWLTLIIFSVYSGLKNSTGYTIHLAINNFQTNAYTIGIAHKHYQGIDAENKKVKIETLTIGFYLFSIEIEFFKIISE